LWDWRVLGVPIATPYFHWSVSTILQFMAQRWTFHRPRKRTGESLRRSEQSRISSLPK
jgi:hypothetical protein